jgi:hypothetical protein
LDPSRWTIFKVQNFLCYGVYLLYYSYISLSTQV